MSSPGSSSHVSNIFRCIKYKIYNHFGNRLVFLLVYIPSSCLEMYQNIDCFSFTERLNKDEYIFPFSNVISPPPNLYIYSFVNSFGCFCTDDIISNVIFT